MFKFSSKLLVGVGLIALLALVVGGLPYSQIARNTVNAQYAPDSSDEVACAITSDAVVGAIVSSTQTYWDASLSAATNVTLDAGKTVWVLGLDATQSFYSLCYSGVYLWVPVGSMTTNPDEVWQNTPLPSILVELVENIISIIL